MTKVYHDVPYLNLLKDVYTNGVQKGDRTGTGTKSVFSRQMRFDLSDGTIPLLTTKKMHTKSIIHEILWYIKGDSNIKYLQDNGVRIWNEWADENGDLGPVYGVQWRRWPVPGMLSIDYQSDPPSPKLEWKYIDQIAKVVDKLRNNPDDRRIIVNSWNVGQLDDMRLPPCHYAFQFYVADGKLSLMLNQRSCDTFLGVPFNIAQYSILLHMFAHVTGLRPSEFIWNGGDVHIYNNHFKQVEQQLSNDPYPSPKLLLREGVKEIDDFVFEDFEISDYKSHEAIKAKVSV